MLSSQQLEAVERIIREHHVISDSNVKEAFNLGLCYGLEIIFGNAFVYQVYKKQQQEI